MSNLVEDPAPSAPSFEQFSDLVTPASSTPSTTVTAAEPTDRKSKMADEEISVDKVSSSSGCPFSFCGLFKADTMHPVVSQLIYWRDPKKSGIVFGAGLTLLFCLAYCSIISVVAWLALLTLGGTISFRVYKGIMSAVQKTNEGNPFKEYLSSDVKAPKEKVDQIVEILLNNFNSTFVKLQHIFLVEDIFDSIKYFLGFWCLTYVGSWFNGLTLVILAYLAAFSLPKVYEMNKAQVDQYLALANAQVQDIVSKVKEKLPFGRKEKAQ